MSNMTHINTQLARDITEAAKEVGLSARALCRAANIPARAWRNTLRGSGGQFATDVQIDAAIEVVNSAKRRQQAQDQAQPQEQEADA